METIGLLIVGGLLMINNRKQFFLLSILSLASVSASANTISGELVFLDASDAVTTTYQAGDTLKLRVTDADRVVMRDRLRRLRFC